MRTAALPISKLMLTLGLALTLALGGSGCRAEGEHHLNRTTRAEAVTALLEVTNAVRATEGASPLRLGNNPAAQNHAERSLADCTASHWDRDGAKPGLRYASEGGHQANGENFYSANECGYPDTGEQKNLDPASMARLAAIQWSQSAGHRETMTDPGFTKVSIGLAWNEHTFKAVQVLENDGVQYYVPPRMSGGILIAKGKWKGEEPTGGWLKAHLRVRYDELPTPLNRAQMATSSCYSTGHLVAVIMPEMNGDEWELNSTEKPEDCPEPRLTPKEARSPATVEELTATHRGTAKPTGQTGPGTTSVRFKQATLWETDGAEFNIETDLSEIIRQHGPGVYTVELHANTGQGVRPDGRVAETPIIAGEAANEQH